MADRTKIEWCDSTFNPWTGCTKVSPGCDHCYAEAWSKRAGDKVGKWGPGAPRVRTSVAMWRQPARWNAQPFVECTSCGWRGADPHDSTPGWTECPACGKEALKSSRRRVFCASLADVFDNEVPVQWRRDLFALISQTPNLDWLLLTKRIGNAREMIADAVAAERLGGWRPLPWPWPNVWIGATIVNQAEADRDIPKLLATPAAVRFVSMEPLLGPVDLPGLVYYGTESSGGIVRLGSKGYTQLDWVIAGGESGHKARAMHPDWARSLRDQCAVSSVPFLFKQWGEWRPTQADAVVDDRQNCVPMYVFPDGQRMARVGKKAAGRLLDGVAHNGFPRGAS